MALMSYELIESSEGSTNLWSDKLIEIIPGCTYNMSFDIKRDSSDTDTNYCYVALNPYDKDKNFLSVERVCLISNTETTLASDLTSGATSATLTSGTNWIADTTYRVFGICDTEYGYNHCKTWMWIKQGGVSGNTVTFNGTYSGKTLPAGTKVREFTSNSTYYYPYLWANDNANWQSNDWWHIDFDFVFNTSVGERCYAAKYFTKGMLMYSHKYEMKNAVLYNKSIIQDALIDPITPRIYKNGIVDCKFQEQYVKGDLIESAKIESSEFIEI